MLNIRYWPIENANDSTHQSNDYSKRKIQNMAYHLIDFGHPLTFPKKVNYGKKSYHNNIKRLLRAYKAAKPIVPAHGWKHFDECFIVQARSILVVLAECLA